MVTGIQKVYDERAKVVTQMKALVEASAKDVRAMTSEENSQYAKLDADYEGFTSTIRSYELAEQRANDGAAKIIDPQLYTANTTAIIDDRGKAKDYEQTFEQYFRYGTSALSPEQRSMMSEMRGTATQVVGTTTLGGYTVPQGFVPEIERAMLDYSGILQAARVIRTATGNALPWPTEDDTTTSAVLVAEAAGFTVADLTFGQTSLAAYKYGTAAKISWELLQDSAFDMSAELANVFGTRFGRAVNSSCTTGTGSAQPNGVVTASTLGKTAASATAVTFAEILDLKHSIDPAYRASNSFGFMLNDAILAVLKKLTIGTSDGRSLWMPSYVAGQPDRIDGTQYWINQGMDSAMTTGKKILLCGDFSKYIIRQVQDFTVLRLDELYAANGLVGFQGYARWDANCINTAAIKHLKLA
jgi:HK97 family phage major capsid protein